MKIIALTDIHGHNTFCESLINDITHADLVILAGDITHFGRIAHLEIILDKIRIINTRILAVHGNCDYPEVLQELQSQQLSVHGQVTLENGLHITGLGGSLSCPGTTPSEYSEKEYKELLEQSAKQLDKDIDFIFVSHQPPFNTLNDKIASGAHVGCKAVRSFIEDFQPLVCITGHIHEGAGIDQIGSTKIINPGPFRLGKYLFLEINNDELKFDIRICPV